MVLTVPAAARNMLRLTEQQEMIVSVMGGRIIAEPVSVAAKSMKVRPPTYTLDELLKGYDADHPLSTEEKAWAYVPPVGNEVW